MSRHLKIAAGLHIAVACFGAGLVAMLWVFAALLAPTFEGSWVVELITAVGRPLALLLLACCGFEMMAAIALLRRHRGAWPALAALSCALIAVFPLGTALAVYTFWALASTKPPPKFTSLTS